MDQFLASSLSFVAIDFETANLDQASVCQVGIAKVMDGVLIDSTSWLVIPPTGVKTFEPRFIRIHGISPRDVQRSGISWQDSLQRIHAFAGDLPFVAHNAPFDKAVYERASQQTGLRTPAAQWFDTLVLSRRYVQAPNHKLKTVTQTLGLPEFNHHEAEADAIAAARIVLEVSQRERLGSVHELWARPEVGRAHNEYKQRSHPSRFTRVADLPAPNIDAHPEHPFYGHHVVITGELRGFSRDEFFITVAELGGQPQLNVTKKTSMFIVADQEELTAELEHSGGTSKQRKAIEYKEAGQSIMFIGAKQAITYLTISQSVTDGQQVKERPVELLSERTSHMTLTSARSVSKESSSDSAQWSQDAISAKDRTQPDVIESITTKPSISNTTDDAHSTQLTRKTRQRVPRISGQVLAVVAWMLMIISGMFLVLFVLGLTVSLFSADSPEVTFLVWVVGMIIIAPIVSAPGLLGFFILRKHKKRHI